MHADPDGPPRPRAAPTPAHHGTLLTRPLRRLRRWYRRTPQSQVVSTVAVILVLVAVIVLGVVVAVVD